MTESYGVATVGALPKESNIRRELPCTKVQLGISVCDELRFQYIRMLREITDLCARCYQRWKEGDFSFSWPAGTFPPPLPMQASALA